MIECTCCDSILDDEEEEDPVDKMMEKIGCEEQHYQVQLCMMENKDWRKCREQVSFIFEDDNECNFKYFLYNL